MNNYERITQEIQGIESNIEMMKSTAVAEELADEINSLSKQLEQLKMYRDLISFNDNLNELYENRRNAATEEEIQEADKKIDEFAQANEQFFAMQFRNNISAIDPENYRNIKERYGVEIVTPERFRGELSADTIDSNVVEEDVAPAVTYDEVREENKIPFVVEPKTEPIVPEQEQQEVELDVPTTDVVDNDLSSITTFEEASEAYTNALAEREELYNQLTDLGEIPRNHDTQMFEDKKAQIAAVDEKIEQLGQLMADLSSPKEEIVEENTYVPLEGGMREATGDAYGDTPEERERQAKDIVLNRYTLDQIDAVLNNYTYLKDEDVCVTIQNVDLTVADFKNRKAKLTQHVVTDDVVEEVEQEQQPVELFSGDIGEGMPSIEDQFRQATGIEFDPEKHEVVYDGAHDELNDEPYTPFTVVEKPVKEAEEEIVPVEPVVETEPVMIKDDIEQFEYETPEDTFRREMGFDFDPEKYQIGQGTGATDANPEDGYYDDGPINTISIWEKQPVVEQEQQPVEPEVEEINEEDIVPAEEVVEEAPVEETHESQYGEGGILLPDVVRENDLFQNQQPNEVEVPEVEDTQADVATEIEEIRPAEEVEQEQQPIEIPVEEEERTSSSRLTRDQIIQDRELDNPDYEQVFNAPGMTDEDIERARAEIDEVPLAQPPVEEEAEEVEETNRVVESIPVENKPEWDPRLTTEQILDALSKDIYEPVGQEYEQYLREVGLDPMTQSQTPTEAVREVEAEPEVQSVDNTFKPAEPPVEEVITETVDAPEENREETPEVPVDDNPQHAPNEETGYAVGGFQYPAVAEQPEQAQTTEPEEEPERDEEPEREPSERVVVPHTEFNDEDLEDEEPEYEQEEPEEDEPEHERIEVPGPTGQLHGRSLDRILYELTLDENNETMDLSKGQRRAITKSRINVTNSFKSRVQHKNFIYNFLGVTSSIIPMFVQSVSRWINKGYTLLHPKAVKNYDAIVEKLAQLSDEDLEVLRTQLTANKAQEYRSYIAIMPLVNQRIAQYIEEKYNTPLREEIFTIQAELMHRYREIDELDREYSSMTPEEQADANTRIAAISEGSVELITRLNELKLELAHNLEGGPGIHSLQESSKVVDNNSGDLGKFFAHKKTLKESEIFNQDQADLGDDLVAAINAGNDERALFAFGDKEMNEYAHTHNKKIGFDRFSNGDYNWRIMPQNLNYGQDPLLGYVFTTISTIGLAKGILTEIHNQGIRKEIEAANQQNIGVNNQINQTNQQNLAANQQNLDTIDQVHSTGKSLEGRGDDYVQGIEQMTRDSVVSHRTAGEYNAGDATNWSFNAEYRTLDHASHESTHVLYDQANASFESIKQGLQDGTMTHAEAIREAQSALQAVESAKMSTYSAFRETMNTYCPAHPQHDYEPLMNYMDDIVNNPTVISRMVDGMQESVSSGTLLQQAVMQVYSPVAAVVKTLPDNIQSFVLPLVTQAAITGYLNRNIGKIVNNKDTEDYERYMQGLYEDIYEDQERARQGLENELAPEDRDLDDAPENTEDQTNTQDQEQPDPEQNTEAQDQAQPDPEQNTEAQDQEQPEPEQATDTQDQQTGDEQTQDEPEQQPENQTQGEPEQNTQAQPEPEQETQTPPANNGAASDEIAEIQIFDNALVVSYADGEELVYIFEGNEDQLGRPGVYKAVKYVMDDDKIVITLAERGSFFRPVKHAYAITEHTHIQDCREGAMENDEPENNQQQTNNDNYVDPEFDFGDLSDPEQSAGRGR